MMTIKAEVCAWHFKETYWIGPIQFQFHWKVLVSRNTFGGDKKSAVSCTFFLCSGNPKKGGAGLKNFHHNSVQSGKNHHYHHLYHHHHHHRHIPHHHQHHDQEILCKLAGIIQSTCVFFSSFSIALIALDRFLFIKHPTGVQISTTFVSLFSSCKPWNSKCPSLVV